MNHFNYIPNFSYFIEFHNVDDEISVFINTNYNRVIKTRSKGIHNITDSLIYGKVNLIRVEGTNFKGGDYAHPNRYSFTYDIYKVNNSTNEKTIIGRHTDNGISNQNQDLLLNVQTFIIDDFLSSSENVLQFFLKVEKADNVFAAWVNGNDVCGISTEGNPSYDWMVDITEACIPGQNIISFTGNGGGGNHFKFSVWKHFYHGANSTKNYYKKIISYDTNSSFNNLNVPFLNTP